MRASSATRHNDERMPWATMTAGNSRWKWTGPCLSRTWHTSRSPGRLPEEWTESDDGPNTWSPFHVVGHLTHIEEIDWLDRTVLILTQTEPRTLEPVDREAGIRNGRRSRANVLYPLGYAILTRIEEMRLR
jgi:hypothetical protein